MVRQYHFQETYCTATNPSTLTYQLLLSRRLVRCLLQGIHKRSARRSDEDACLRLTQAGMERSDVIGPWFNSEQVNELIATFDLT